MTGPDPGAVRLQPLTRAKVAALGDAGAQWQADLTRVLGDLAERWELTLGRALPGGSASYVCTARTAAGEERVLKVVVPDPDLVDEGRVLGAADGRGYAVLHDHAREHRALLLERLGPSLELARRPVEEVLDVLVDILHEAWRVPPEVGVPVPDRAHDLLAAMERRQLELGGPAAPAVVREARACADRLRAGAGGADDVCVHGDPHPGNVLRVLVDRPGAPAGHVLVDPDGLRCDPAYDVGIALRDLTGALQGADARELLTTWTRRAAARAGLKPDRVRDWAYLERVSTGVYLASLGADRLAGRFLDSAAALLR